MVRVRRIVDSGYLGYPAWVPSSTGLDTSSTDGDTRETGKQIP
jgi:hypothetical protein